MPFFSLFKRDHKPTTIESIEFDKETGSEFDDDLARGLGGLSLERGRDASSKLQNPRYEQAFVGGFVTNARSSSHPAAVGSSRKQLQPLPSTPQASNSARPASHKFPVPSTYGPAPPGPLPIPPAPVAMPVPVHEAGQGMSQTMRFALGTAVGRGSALPASDTLRPPLATTPVRPHSDPAVPPFSQVAPATPQRSHSATNGQVPAAFPPKRAAGGPLSPAQSTPPRPHAASAPASSTPSVATSPAPDAVQCSGIKQDGTRCLRKVKVGPALTRLNPDIELDRFCHQHAKQFLEPTGTYLEDKMTKKKVWIEYGPFIPKYLQLDTQAALREEMRKSRSEADELGYIYTFEIRDPNNTEEIHFKVGRAVKLNKRLDEWSKQCGSKEQVLRGWWPGTVEMDQNSHMKGRVDPGHPGLWCHRVERLVHLELADLAVNAQYLDPEYPNQKAKPGDGKAKLKRKPCTDCGAIHKEIFSFPRPENSPYKDVEWEKIVQPVIDKWGGFVAAYLREPLPST